MVLTVNSSKRSTYIIILYFFCHICTKCTNVPSKYARVHVISDEIVLADQLQVCARLLFCNAENLSPLTSDLLPRNLMITTCIRRLFWLWRTGSGGNSIPLVQHKLHPFRRTLPVSADTFFRQTSNGLSAGAPITIFRKNYDRREIFGSSYIVQCYHYLNYKIYTKIFLHEYTYESKVPVESDTLKS